MFWSVLDENNQCKRLKIGWWNISEAIINIICEQLELKLARIAALYQEQLYKQYIQYKNETCTNKEVS
jgi:hypothetical protein